MTLGTLTECVQRLNAAGYSPLTEVVVRDSGSEIAIADLTQDRGRILVKTHYPDNTPGGGNA